MPNKTESASSDDVPLKAPRRPLSAYNFFFQDQRAALLGKDGGEVSDEEDACNKKRKHRKAHGKIGFTALARHVGAAWKALGSQERSQYEQRFKDDKVRYQKELQEYEEKLSNLIHLAQVKKALKTIRAQEAEKEAKQQQERQDAAAFQAQLMMQQQQFFMMQQQQAAMAQNNMNNFYGGSYGGGGATSSYGGGGGSFASILQQAIDMNAVHHSGEQIHLDGTPRVKRRCSIDRETLVAPPLNIMEQQHQLHEPFGQRHHHQDHHDEMDNFVPIPLSALNLNDPSPSEALCNVMQDIATWDGEDILSTLPTIDISAAFESDVEEEVDVVPPSPTTSTAAEPVDHDTISFLQEFIYDDTLFT